MDQRTEQQKAQDYRLILEAMKIEFTLPPAALQVIDTLCWNKPIQGNWVENAIFLAARLQTGQRSMKTWEALRDAMQADLGAQ